jgi:glycosyltransferase involved in cell wall biosynthesis
VLHLTDRLGGRGGAPRHLQGIVASLVRGGHEVQVAGGEGPGAGYECATSVVPGLEARDDAAADLRPLLASFRPDVVHVHTIVNPRVLEWASGERALVTVQDHRYFCPGKGKWTQGGDVCDAAMSEEACRACFDDEPYFRQSLDLTKRRLAALAKLRVVVLSDYMRRELLAVGLRPEAVFVIPPFVHAVDLEAEADGPPCVLFVGRLTEHKGARDALAAWRLSGVDLPLVFAGTGPLRTELEGSGATVLGWLDPPALSRVYRRARALVLPSRWQEPFGIVGLEAQGMGVPVVAWESGGVREWHRGPHRVPWGDIEALARALRSAVEGPRPAPRVEDPAAPMERLLALYRLAHEDLLARRG